MKILKTIFYLSSFVGCFGGIVFGKAVAAPSFVIWLISIIIYRCKYDEWIWKDN